MAAPTAADLSAFLGPRYPVDTGQAIAILSVVTAMCRAYTRSSGFDSEGLPNPDLSAVILSASARLLSHSRQISVSETYGPNSAAFASAPFSWSVAELATLDRYRVKAL